MLCERFAFIFSDTAFEDFLFLVFQAILEALAVLHVKVHGDLDLFELNPVVEKYFVHRLRVDCKHLLDGAFGVVDGRRTD